jgi:DNA modification methylase
MNPYYEHGGITIHSGDCVDSMSQMPGQSIQCCVTSPPYFGLRDYGHDSQIGLEETPQAFIARLVDVFDEVHRVLRDDGTLWLNIGDSYATTQGAPAGVKTKELIGIPWRLAFALQDAGWYLRQDIIWHKPNPMPESVKDRCTKAHEYLFLLTKKPRYFFDHEAIKEPADPKNHRPSAGIRATAPGSSPHGGPASGDRSYVTRNKRDVWTVAPKPYKGAHFAVFPEALVEPCILAGSRVGDTVIDPFAGSGTVGVVSNRHGRNFVGCELNSDYCEIAANRLRQNVLPLD